MPFLLVALFILVPIAELAVIIQVGQAIGVWWTIALLIADSILGSLLMRSQGRAAWRRFNEAVRASRVPAREVADGVLVIANPTVSSRPALEQLGRRLPSLGAQVLGVVLNAPEPNRLSGEDYTYQYAYAASEADTVRPTRALRTRRRRSLHSTGWR